MKKIKFIMWVLILCALFISLSDRVHAKGDTVLDTGGIPADYSNRFYSTVPEMYGSPKTCFWKKTGSGYELAVYSDKLYINQYDASYKLISSKSLELELPKWGGFYSGEDYYYVVCGKNRNSGEDNGGEVYRVIQYDKQLNRLKAASFTANGTSTAIPFDAGNVSIAEYGGNLVVYTSRERTDGHLSNIALSFDTSTMEPISNYADLVSHSFRQIVKYDEKGPVYVDLSDGTPERGVYLQSPYGNGCLLSVAGDSGDNRTGTEVNNLVVTDKAYLIAGVTEFKEAYNIYYAVYNKADKSVEGEYLTAYTPFNYSKVSGNTQIIDAGDNVNVILWNTRQGQVRKVEYILVNDEGEKISGLKTVEGNEISYCDPIFADGTIQWPVIDDGIIKIQKVEDLSATGQYEASIEYKESSNPWDGSIDKSWYQSEKNHFEISTAAQLAGLADLVNSGITFEGKTVELLNDVFMNKDPLSTKYQWTSIAYCESRNELEAAFEGTFQGNKHGVYNIYVQEKGGGLFGRIGKKGCVSGVNVSQGYLGAGGAIAYYNEGIIQFCRNSSMTGNNDEYAVGGICNYNYGLVYGCQNYGEVWGSDVGGIVGSNSSKNDESTVSECSNHGLVAASHEGSGIAEYNYAWIYHCYNVGILQNTWGDYPKTGRLLSGICANDKTEYIHNCYTACGLNYAAGTGPANDNNFSDITTEENDKKKSTYYGGSGETERISYNELRSDEMIDKLNTPISSCSNSLAWEKDSTGENQFFPVNKAEVNFRNGTLKRIPEIWGLSSKDGIQCGTQETSLKLYFANIENPQLDIQIDDNSIVSVESEINGKNATLKLIPKGRGETQLRVTVAETEETVRYVHVVKVSTQGSTGEDPEEDHSNQYKVTYHFLRDDITLSSSGNLEIKKPENTCTAYINKGSSISGIYLSPWKIDVAARDKIFVDWSLKEDGSSLLGNYGYQYIPEGDIDLYAIYKDAVLVTYHYYGYGENSQNGAAENKKEVKMQKGTTLYPDAVTYQINEAENPTPGTQASADGLAYFTGWSKTKGGAVDFEYYNFNISDNSTAYTHLSSGMTLNNNLDLYAVWKPAVKVTFDGNGGTVGRRYNENYGAKYTHLVPEGQRIDYWSMLYDMSAISNDTNVAFKGWCEDKSGKGNIITPQQINSYRINKETVLYAIYGPNDNTADNSQYNKQDSENENEHIHSLVKVNKTSATYTKAGNTTYYYCETCGKYYSDKAGTKEIKKNSWIIPKLSKRSQSMTVKGASKKVKRSKVKKKNLVIKVITVKAAEGKVSYKIVGGNKKSKKALKIDGKTGKLTIKKGTKKGSYKVTVAVTAAGNDKYKACTKQVSVNIKVK